MGRVVVGVDGSPSSREALRVAVEEARLRSRRLRAVTAWRIPVGMFADGMAPALDPLEFERNARAVLDAEIDRLGSDVDDIEIDRVVVEGQPAEALLRESRYADILVVGSRGRGGFTGLLLGSVSQQCVQHASCPVIIVRAREEGD